MSPPDRSAQWHLQVSAVECALNEYDPIDLRHRAAPLDEYEAEAVAIVAAVRRCTSADCAAKAIWQVFRRAFGEDTAGPLHAYRGVATAVFEALNST